VTHATRDFGHEIRSTLDHRKGGQDEVGEEGGEGVELVSNIFCFDTITRSVDESPLVRM